MCEEQTRRIAELEKTVTEAMERISYLNTTNSMRRTTIEEQTARIAELEQALGDVLPDVLKRIQQQSETIARLEQDNRRLRHLDAMPVDAMRVVCMNSMYDAQVGGMSGYDVADFINARDELVEWLDGDA